MNLEKRTGWYLLLFFMSFYCMLSIGHFGGDGYEDYLTAESIVLDGNIYLYDNPEDTDELQYDLSAGTKTKDGKISKSRGGLGVPLLLAPFYATGHALSAFFKNIPHDYVTMMLVSFANPVFLALSCLLIFVIAQQMNFSRSISVILSFIYGLSTMTPVYVRTGFSEPAMILLLLLAISVLFKYKVTRRVRYLPVAAFLIVYMVFTATSSVIFVPCLLLYLIWIICASEKKIADKTKNLALFVSILAIGAIGIGFYNYIIYGSPLAIGAVNVVATGKKMVAPSHILKGLYYYLLSPGKSLLIFNLPIILGFVALARTPREGRKEVTLFILIFIINLLFFVRSFRRGSLFSWGPRYLMPSVPLLVLLIGYYIETFKSLTAKIAVWGLSIAGFLIVLPCMFINQSKFYFFVTEKLGLDEYLINFIPDLSPIKGAWYMFASRIHQGFGGTGFTFVFEPDYRLVEPITSSMDQYNYIDIWFVKIAELSPSFSPFIYVVFIFLALMAGVSAYKLCRMR